MGMPITFTKILTAANSTIVATSQARASSGALTLSSGPPVLLDSQRRVQLVMTASNNAAVMVVSGTNESGTPISENITVGATATTLVTAMDYKNITSITSTTLVGNIIAGTNATGSCPWIMANPWIPPSINIAATSSISGAVVYGAEYTLDIDPCGVRSNAPLTAVNAFSAPQMTNQTNSQTGLITAGTSGSPVACSAWRITITAGTGGLQVSSLDGAGAF